MGQVIAVDTRLIPWKVPGHDWRGAVKEGEPVVYYKEVTAENARTRVQVSEYEAGHTERAHSHARAEILFVLAGEMTIGEDLCVGSDVALFIDHDTVYGPLVAGPNGVRFLRVEMP